MLQITSEMIIADNTGIKRVAIIGMPRKGTNPMFSVLGDVVVVAVKDVMPSSSYKKGDVVSCMIVRVRKEVGRKDGSYIRFGDNAAVIVEKDKEGFKMIGKRIFGPVAKEVRDRGYKNITSFADETI